MEGFMTYQPEAGLASMLDRMDWDGVLPSQAYNAVLNRIPESGEAAAPQPGYSAGEIFADALESDEFQGSLVHLLFDAYPEKRRLIFVHVMKCAGTDLIAHLSHRYPHIYNSCTEPRWVGKPELYEFLRNFSLSAVGAHEICWSGHVNLPSILEARLYRFGDDMFTVVREPVDRILSMVNYAVGIMADCRFPLRPDRLEWFRALDREPFTRPPSPSEALDLARQVLRNEQVVEPNVLCRALGRGDVLSALDAMVRSNIEVTDTRRYERWLRTRWGVQASRRLNASEAVISREDLSSQDLEYLTEKSWEDWQLYDLIDRRLAETGEASLRGLDLAEVCLDLWRRTRPSPDPVMSE